MPNLNAVTDNATGRVKRYGYANFSASIVTGETLHTLSARVAPPSGVPLHHLTVRTGAFVEMSAAEKAASDAAVLAEERASLRGALSLPSYPNLAATPAPVPGKSLVVALADNGSGRAGLAVSVNGGAWQVV